MLKSVKSGFSVDVPTKLKTAGADSSVTPETEVRLHRWKRQGHVQGVLGVHVDNLIRTRSSQASQEATAHGPVSDSHDL